MQRYPPNGEIFLYDSTSWMLHY